MKIKNKRRSSTPLNIVTSFNIDKKKTKKKNNKMLDSIKKTSFFHLPLINFSNENENLSDSEIRNRKISHSKKSSTNKIKLNDSQINNYNVNLNVNIQNNYNSNNESSEKNYSGRKKKDTMDLILKNLKGLSENLKNPTSFFRNYDNHNASTLRGSNLTNKSINRINKNLIENMNLHIKKIEEIYEKIIVSLIEKLMKNKK